MQRLSYDPNDLKSPISEVFTNHPKKWNELINLKALLGAYLANLDRVFKGVFGQELQLEGTKEQYELFKKVFPIVGNAIEQSFGLQGFSEFCGKLAAIRNVCMHAFAEANAALESIDESFMKSIPNWNPDKLPYVVEGNKMTLAGLLAILLCLGNQKMVGGLMASGIAPFVESIALWPDYKLARGKDYSIALEHRLGNALEQEIRTLKGDDVFSAIWGEYAFRVAGTPKGFSYFNEKKEDALYRVWGSWKDGRLTIKKGSNYHVYFPTEYVLEIVDEAYFAECASQVPPFLFVAFLYRKGVQRFDRNSLSENDLKLFPKLNKAKFYVDKSIHVILLDSTVSDLRMISKAATPQALFAILNLEWSLRTAHRAEIENPLKYSTIMESLAVAGVEPTLIEDTILLRNFFAHGSIFGDYIGMTQLTYRKIELLDCINVFKRLALALGKNEPRAATRLKEDIKMRLAEQLIDLKYKSLSKMWYASLNGSGFNWEVYAKGAKRVANCYVTEEDENELAWFASEDSWTRYNVYRFHSALGMKLGGIGQQSPCAELVIPEYLDHLIFERILGTEAKKAPRSHGNRLVCYHEYD